MRCHRRVALAIRTAGAVTDNALQLLGKFQNMGSPLWRAHYSPAPRVKFNSREPPATLFLAEF
jgi:hypothetical protein